MFSKTTVSGHGYYVRTQSLDIGLYRQVKQVCLVDPLYLMEARCWRILIIAKVMSSFFKKLLLIYVLIVACSSFVCLFLFP